MSSKRSQSECVAQNSARSAGLSEDGRLAIGSARIASASPVSERPTLKPLSRSVCAKAASFRRIAVPMLAAACSLPPCGGGVRGGGGHSRGSEVFTPLPALRADLPRKGGGERRL